MVHCAHMVAVVKVNGEVMREVRHNDSDTIFIPFGSEYEICFNNLSSNRAVVRVEIDGEDVLSGNELVIQANSEGSLKGFMNKDGSEAKNRFKFIKMTDKIAEHRGTDSRDGLIRIEYQFEKPYEYPKYRNPIMWDYNFNDIWYSQYNQTKGSSNNTSGFLRGTISPSSVNFSCSSGVGGSGACASNEVTKGISENDSYANSDKGITASGSIVGQKFGSTYVRELYPEKHVIVFELRGQKNNGKKVSSPITVKTKLECENCGTVNKSHNKFCRECGTCLI